MAYKKVTHIEKCVCGGEPIILVHNILKGVEYTVKCSRCGRGGIFYNNTKTTYQAIKKWNTMQIALKDEKGRKFCKRCKEEIGYEDRDLCYSCINYVEYWGEL